VHWHVITINFTLSAIALIALGTGGHRNAVASLVAAQFAGRAAVGLLLLRNTFPLILGQ